MLKKLLMVFVVGFLSVTLLTACGEKFMSDGVYRAFKETVGSNGGPQVTTVTVTVEDGKIVHYDIDTVQSHTTASGYEFNDQSKKELGYLYGMHFPGSNIEGDLTDDDVMAEYQQYLEDNDKLEWFEQAELLEEYWLDNGIKAPVAEGKFDYVAGVTITDNDYVEIAREAVQNAKDGKTQVVTTSGADIIWVTAKVDKDGNFTELKLDTRQSSIDENENFVWNEKTKQELGYLYGMHFRSSGIEGDLTDDDVMDEYQQYLDDNDKLEWFEQADMLTEYVLANGLGDVELEGGKIVKDDDTPEAVTAITVTVSHYYDVLDQLYKDFA